MQHGIIIICLVMLVVTLSGGMYGWGLVNGFAVSEAAICGEIAWESPYCKAAKEERLK